MEVFYTANSRVVNNITYYFVKKYTSFPEYKDVPTVLEAMGMHKDFYRACDIAKVYDEAIINKLQNDLHLLPEDSRANSMNGVRALTHTLIKNTHQAILKLRLAGIN